MSDDGKREYSPSENDEPIPEDETRQAGYAKSKFLGVNSQFKNPFRSKSSPNRVSLEHDETTNKKENYQIAICQDGKFVVTFDTGRCRSVVENNVCN